MTTEAKRQYYKEWYEKNKLKRKAYDMRNKEHVRDWHVKNRDRVLQHKKRYREKNREKEKLRHKKYFEENRDKILERARAYREKNKEKRHAYDKAYKEKQKQKTILEQQQLLLLQTLPIITPPQMQIHFILNH